MQCIHTEQRDGSSLQQKTSPTYQNCKQLKTKNGLFLEFPLGISGLQLTRKLKIWRIKCG